MLVWRGGESSGCIVLMASSALQLRAGKRGRGLLCRRDPRRLTWRCVGARQKRLQFLASNTVGTKIHRARHQTPRRITWDDAPREYRGSSASVLESGSMTLSPLPCPVGAGYWIRRGGTAAGTTLPSRESVGLLPPNNITIMSRGDVSGNWATVCGRL